MDNSNNQNGLSKPSSNTIYDDFHHHSVNTNSTSESITTENVASSQPQHMIGVQSAFQINDDEDNNCSVEILPEDGASSSNMITSESNPVLNVVFNVSMMERSSGDDDLTRKSSNTNSSSNSVNGVRQFFSQQCCIEWKNISYPTLKKPLLHNLSGFAVPGKVCADFNDLNNLQ